MTELRAGDKLDALAERYWRWTCREFPLTAFLAGQGNDDPTMFRESPLDFDRRAQDAGAMLVELDAIDSAGLDVDGSATHSLLRRELDDLQGFHQVGAHQRPWLLPVGPEFNTIYFANIASVGDAASAALYADRLASLPAFFGDVGANLRAGCVRGFRYPRVVLERAQENMRAAAGGPAEATPWFGPFKRSVASTSAAVQLEAKRACATIGEQIQPALVALADLLRDELTPHSRETIACTDDLIGKAYYERWVRHFTTTSRTPDEIHALGLADAERIESDIESVAAAAGFAGDVSRYRRFIAGDSQFIASSALVLRERVEVIAKRIDGKLPYFFGRLPRSSYGVESIPIALAPRMPPAYAQSNPGDNSGPGVIWVSGLPEMCPLYLAPSLALHEGWPGHLMHLALMQEATKLPAFRRFNAPKYTACLEGWAMYCEDLGDEMDLYQTPHERFGRLDMELWRALRLVVDTGIHWKGWSRDRAITELSERTSLARATIESEVDRYIALPAQALAYQIGHLEFRRLRAHAQRALGDRFNLRRYHDVLMGAGPVTLPVLSEVVETWLAAESLTVTI